MSVSIVLGTKLPYSTIPRSALAISPERPDSPLQTDRAVGGFSIPRSNGFHNKTLLYFPKAFLKLIATVFCGFVSYPLAQSSTEKTLVQMYL